MLYSWRHSSMITLFFFFNDTATTEIYTLSLHDALPICTRKCVCVERQAWKKGNISAPRSPTCTHRSEEHTSELQSQSNLVCRLLLEKKKNNQSLVIKRTANKLDQPKAQSYWYLDQSALL